MNEDIIFQWIKLFFVLRFLYIDGKKEDISDSKSLEHFWKKMDPNHWSSIWSKINSIFQIEMLDYCWESSGAILEQQQASKTIINFNEFKTENNGITRNLGRRDNPAQSRVETRGLSLFLQTWSRGTTDLFLSISLSIMTILKELVFTDNTWARMHRWKQRSASELQERTEFWYWPKLMQIPENCPFSLLDCSCIVKESPVCHCPIPFRP